MRAFRAALDRSEIDRAGVCIDLVLHGPWYSIDSPRSCFLRKCHRGNPAKGREHFGAAKGGAFPRLRTGIAVESAIPWG